LSAIFVITSQAQLKWLKSVLQGMVSSGALNLRAHSGLLFGVGRH
jgi:hypothetical protein